MSDKVFYSEGQIRGNIHRTLKANLLTYLPEEILDKLTDTYFRDKEGNLLCAYTGEPLDNVEKKLELEHIISVSNGGGTILFNVVPSLKEINRAGEKWDNNLLDWWKNSKYFDISRLENIVNYMLEGYEYCAKQDGVFTFEVNESEEQDDTIKDEEYFDEMQKDVEEKEIIKKHDINTYKSFLNSLIIELENNKIDVSSYLERIKNLEKENVFEELDEQVIYQKVMLGLMRKYANNEKYKISSEVDYKKIIHNLGLDNIKDNFEVKLENFVMTLNEEKKVPVNVHKSNEKLVNKMDKNTNTFIDKSNKLLDKIKSNKKVKDEDILKYELEKQIIKVFRKTSNKISFNLMMEYITEYPEILYNDNFDFDNLIKEHYKKYDKYADLIIGFCREYRLFPSLYGTKEYEGKTEKVIYRYYQKHKHNLSKEKHDEIEKLKDLYISEKYDKYANVIIGFCEEYKSFPIARGTLEYEGISEKAIYRYYKRHKDKFSKEKLEEIGNLKDLYQDKSTKKKTEEEIDNYANLIIGFCSEYKEFPSKTGTKEYEGISEGTIYGYYPRHKDKFSKEKLAEIERLSDLYQDKRGRKKIVQVENKLDNTKGKGR